LNLKSKFIQIKNVRYNKHIKTDWFRRYAAKPAAYVRRYRAEESSVYLAG